LTLPRLDARRLDDVPLGEWVERTVGPGQAAAFLRALVRLSTYIDDANGLSAGVAVDQLRSALRGSVLYLDGGWQTLVDGLRACARECGVEIRTSAAVKAIRTCESGALACLASGEELRAKAAILAVGPRAVCDMLELPEGAPLREWMVRSVPVKAACLDVALHGLPRPGERFALGLDRPLYFSVHSAAARLAPDGVAVLHVMKYLGADGSASTEAVERELEDFLERLQPGWGSRVAARRYLPELTVAHSLPRAESRGLAGRPAVALAERANIYLAGDWVGPEGLLADASAASARAAAAGVLAALAQEHARAGGSVAHVAT
jgi:phytoene dehydrogenase-like protein